MNLLTHPSNTGISHYARTKKSAIGNKKMLTATQLQSFYEIIEQCHSAKDVKTINNIIQSNVRKLMPHNMTAYGIGEIGNRKVLENVNLGFPPDYIKQVIDKNNLLASPVAKQWVETLEPVLITQKNIPKAWPLIWQKLFSDHNINNIIAHGLVDTNGKLASYFTFANFEETPTEEQLHLIKLLVPHFHVAISSALQPETKSSDKAILSKRETEIIKWVYAGKTNSGIAELLNISAFTVKNHIKNILDKLGAENRTHAAAKAVSLGIIEV
ncbi:hypothetical protein MNBD_GAMMA12-2134 [hydrothermal vent metagenome]|uniref:HTH luxR-type domain-containing protein n=1 Tax=hydrothermal vent metagenome TaxID=652676 RepID=A0A3B0Y6P7_9ZZZZ